MICEQDRSLLLLLLHLLGNFFLNGSPVDFSNFLGSAGQFFAVFFLADALEVFLAEGDHSVKVDLVVAGQFEGTLPPVAVDVHPDGSVIELVLKFS